jgi:hypothetical protein
LDQKSNRDTWTVPRSLDNAQGRNLDMHSFLQRWTHRRAHMKAVLFKEHFKQVRTVVRSIFSTHAIRTGREWERGMLTRRTNNTAQQPRTTREHMKHRKYITPNECEKAEDRTMHFDQQEADTCPHHIECTWFRLEMIESHLDKKDRLSTRCKRMRWF